MPLKDDVIRQYCKELNLFEDQTTRILDLFHYMTELYPEQKFEDVFISESSGMGGERAWLTLFVFSNNAFVEASNPFQRIEISITPYVTKCTYIQIIVNDFNTTGSPNEKSNLLVRAPFNEPTRWGFHATASKQNCAKLWNIIENYIKKYLLYTEK